MSRILLNIYLEKALQKWYRKLVDLGISVVGQDSSLFSFCSQPGNPRSASRGLEYMIIKLRREFEKRRLNINLEKTVFM